MKNTGNRGRAGICILIVLVCCAGCGAKVTIQLHPQPGEVRNVKITATQAIEATAMGNKTQQTASNAMGITIQCLGVDPSGTATARVTFDEIDLSGLGAMSGLAGGLADQAGKLSGKDLDLIGKSFSMKMSPLGRVEEVKGMSEILAETAKKAAETAGKAAESMPLPPKVIEMTKGISKMIEGQLQGTFGDNAMCETMEDLMTMYPEGPVRVGATWTKNVVRACGAMPMKRSETWRLAGRKDGLLRLEMKSTITPNLDARPSFLGEMARLMIEYTGDSSGIVILDEATGWVVKSDTTTQLDGKVTMNSLERKDSNAGPVALKIKIKTHVESAP
jgi:hypothetical protein